MSLPQTDFLGEAGRLRLYVSIKPLLARPRLFMYFPGPTREQEGLQLQGGMCCSIAHERPKSDDAALRRRKPMLLFEFDGALFKFNANTPAFDPLFQFPPRRAAIVATLSWTWRLALDPTTKQATNLIYSLSDQSILFHGQ